MFSTLHIPAFVECPISVSLGCALCVCHLSVSADCPLSVRCVVPLSVSLLCWLGCVCCMYVYVCMCSVYVCVYVCMCVCMCSLIFMHPKYQYHVSTQCLILVYIPHHYRRITYTVWCYTFYRSTSEPSTHDRMHIIRLCSPLVCHWCTRPSLLTLY